MWVIPWTAVPFIGILAREHSRRQELLQLFQQENAVAVFDNVNQIEPVLKEVL